MKLWCKQQKRLLFYMLISSVSSQLVRDSSESQLGACEVGCTRGWFGMGVRHMNTYLWGTQSVKRKVWLASSVGCGSGLGVVLVWWAGKLRVAARLNHNSHNISACA